MTRSILRPNCRDMTYDPDPIAALLAAPDTACLAVIAGVEGPSYRPLGAMMTVLDPELWVGGLSSGCIERDIAGHGATATAPRMLRYGRGSPFMDLSLPCGGGLDILLLPGPDREVLRALAARRAARVPVTLRIDLETGALALQAEGATRREPPVLWVRFDPPPRFLVFGKGPEAVTFAGLVHSAGYPNLTLSPDPETLAQVAGPVRLMQGRAFPEGLAIDPQTALVLFFHDHDWEPPLLAAALETPAFYIGAQGSQRARDTRLATLRAMGIGEDALARLSGPIGLIPSTRDPRTLAVSVLAEVLAKVMTA